MHVQNAALIPASRDREEHRVAAVRALELLDEPAHEALPGLCRLAARLCGSENATINIFDDRWQVPLVHVGATLTPVPRADAMCEVVVRSRSRAYTADATCDARFVASPFVRSADPVRMYVSVPLTTAQGACVGTLCVYDKVARRLTQEQVDSVELVAAQVIAIFELRTAGRQIARLAERATVARRETREVLAHASDGFLSLDPAGRIVAWNDAAERIFGYRAADVIGKDFVDLAIPAERRQLFRGRMAEAAASEGSHVAAPQQVRTVAADGSERLIEPRIWATRQPDGLLKGFHAFLRDVSAAAAAEHARHEAEQLFQVAFDRAPIGMAVVGVDELHRGEVLRVNASLQAMLPRINLVGSHLAMIIAEEFVAEAIDAFTELADGRIEGYEGVRKVTSDGVRHSWLQVNAALIRDGRGKPLHALMQVRDITRERAHEEWLTRQAMSDSLTQLPNRLAVITRLNAALTELRDVPVGVGVLFLDVDGFKRVNDVHGHAAGDGILRRIGKYLSRAVPANGFPGQLGGDEFAVVISASDEASVRALSAELSAGVARAAGLDGVGGSVGCAWTRDPATAAPELLATADRHMYEQKRMRKANRLVELG